MSSAFDLMFDRDTAAAVAKEEEANPSLVQQAQEVAREVTKDLQDADKDFIIAVTRLLVVQKAITRAMEERVGGTKRMREAGILGPPVQHPRDMNRGYA